MKRALITGINGFVGPYLKNELEENGYAVFGLGTEIPGGRERYHQCDITDKKRVVEVIKDVEPQYVFHLAGISSPPFAEEHPDITYQVNVEGTRNLLDAAQDLTSPPQLLIVGSAHVYGEPIYLPIDEQHPLRGVGVYVNSRLQQEQLVRTYMARLPLVMTRSFNHTGPRQPDTFVVSKIVKHSIEIKRGMRKALEIGDITVKRDISDVRDVVRAYRLLLGQGQRSIVCNVCRGTSIALKEIIEYVKLLTHLDELPVMVSQAFIRAHEVADMCGDNRLLSSLIAWEPSIDYPTMIRTIYEFWDHNI